MEQANIIFDSRNTYFKTPSGAVVSDTEITYRILVAKALHPDCVHIVVKYDRHDEPARYQMNGGEETPAETDTYLEYTLTLAIHDTGLYWYRFEIETPKGILRVGRDQDNAAVITDDDAAWQQTVYQRKYDVPDWLYGGIYYHIFVDRFHRSGRQRFAGEGQILRDDWGGVPVWEPQDGQILNNDFFGGDLEGIRQKLPYLASLHVTCIYLSPIFEAYSNHKYDTANYERIDPMFGSEEDFQRLCREANDLGIRVICDGVFSHTGADSIYFDKHGRCGGSGAYNNPDSPYRSWYCFREDGSYDCWWDFETLPKLNKRDPGYIRYITGENGIVRKWLRAGASGWRLDVADELDGGFLDTLTEAAKTEKSDALILGEVWEDASNKIAYDERKNYFEGGRLDSVTNYPVRNGIIEFIRNGDSQRLRSAVESIIENYPPEVTNCLMNILGTHDSPRIITALAGADLGPDPTREAQAHTHLDENQWEEGIRLLKMASLIQMTLPGLPCIYYGDEAGTEGYKDPFNRTCYPWDQENQDLLQWYRKLTEIRSAHGVFRQGGYRTIDASDGLFAFERYCGYGMYWPVITAVNRGPAERELSLEGQWRDLLTGRIVSGNVSVFPNEALLLERSL
ncbi:MAG: alpha-amylase family glycosyl hydrolase [Bacillota bacterium]|nr:alpha-amylase family glycosyl hydrolase [Bacillota bacterium]